MQTETKRRLLMCSLPSTRPCTMDFVRAVPKQFGFDNAHRREAQHPSISWAKLLQQAQGHVALRQCDSDDSVIRHCARQGSQSTRSKALHFDHSPGTC
mmetsp:Transcript_30843/g.66483  ORF Transcript_30843/g.66483 Transcript_30843/m.66483 type:complete len:98 (-) Transcript_30843:367-660(-)